jgi:hypothetical protein
VDGREAEFRGREGVVSVIAVVVVSLIGRGGWKPLIKASKCLFTVVEISLHKAIRGLWSQARSLWTALNCKYSS